MVYGDQVDFSSLLGKTIEKIEGLDSGSDDVKFYCADGSKFWMGHTQDCCESVDVEDVIGDVSDLIGSPITLAEVSTSGDDPEGYEREYPPESCTWTFYRLATAKGHVDIRWLGESNGYYSESVYFQHGTF